MKKSQVLPFTFDNMPVRGKLLHLEDVAAGCPSLIEATDETTRTLLDMLLACAITVQDFKSGSSMTLQIQSAETGALFVAHCSEQGQLKAYANDIAKTMPFVVHGKKGATFSATVHRKEQVYQSLIPMEYDSAREAVEAYFTQSVQAKTYLRVWPYEGENGVSCTALFLQALPEETPDDDGDNWVRLAYLLDTVTAEEATAVRATELLHRLFHEDQVRLFEALPLAFVQESPREKMMMALLSLGATACREMLLDGPIMMEDAYTGTTETFTADDIDALFGKRH